MYDPETQWLIEKAPAGEAIAAAANEVVKLVLEKNVKYGNSAIEPVSFFSTADSGEQIRVRLDDKLSRLRNGLDDDEDVVLDLMGYLLLLRVVERGTDSASR